MRRCLVLALLLSLLFTPAAPAVELVGPGKIFVRFTNTRPDDASIRVRLNVVPNHHQPFTWNGKTIYIGANGEVEGADGAAWIAPGERSPWIDVGQYMNLRGTRSPQTYLSPVLCGVFNDAEADGLHVMAEVAAGPGGLRVLRRLEIDKPEIAYDAEWSYPWNLRYGVWNGRRPVLPTLGLLIPSRPDLVVRVYTLEEALAWQADVIEEFPETGKKPERLIFVTRAHPTLFDGLGYTGFPESIVQANLGDEISIHLTASEEEMNRRFRAELRARGFTPAELLDDERATKARGLPVDEQWELVTVVPALPEKPKQFYESADFRYRLWGEELAAKREAAEQANPDKTVVAGANFSPHMNVWPDERQWIGPFRDGSLSMVWSEDWWWQLPEISPQGYGYLLAGMRLAASYHDIPIQFYIMPFTGNSTDNFKRMNALALANNTTIFNHFVTDPQVLTTWDYISIMDSPATFQAIHDVIHGFGAVEDRLAPGRVAPAEVAILVSRAGDTWDTEDLGGAGHLYGAKFNVNNDERKAIYLALRHAQTPVDLITDEDIADGRLAPYKVLYVVGSEMLGSAVDPLRQWVRDGGVVYATAGGGLLDEYREPNTALHEMYGIRSHDLDRVQRHIRPRRDLPGADVLGHLQLSNGLNDWPGLGPWDRAVPGDLLEVPAILHEETLTPAGAKVVAKLDHPEKRQARVGAVAHRFGDGTTVYCGTLLGLAYLRPAATASSQILPTEYPADIRRMITAPLKIAGVQPRVVASQPLVETTHITSDAGDAIVLINWRDEPANDVTVRFPGLDAQRVRSWQNAGHVKGDFGASERGELEVQVVDGVPQVTLDVTTWDVLYVD